MKFKDPKFKHEIFVRIDMKHFVLLKLINNLFAINFYLLLKLFVGYQNEFMFMHNFCSCYIKKF